MLCGFPSNRVLPSAYADEISYYEQLNNLCKKVNEVIEEFNSLTDTYVTIDFFTTSQNNQDKDWGDKLANNISIVLNELNSEVYRLEELIKKATVGKVVVFDPTYGIKNRPIEHVIRNIYGWLRYYADYAGTIDNLQLSATVRDGYNLTAKVFDLYNMLYYSKETLPNPDPYVNNYVMKNDILAWYFEHGGERNE